MTLIDLLHEQQFIAWLSIGGTILGGVGSLYLAYDLLGGSKGPLRMLTRVVTYSILMVLIYIIFLKPLFALICGIGMGLLLTLEFSAAARERHEYEHAREAAEAEDGELPALPLTCHDHHSPEHHHRSSLYIYGILRGLVLGLAAAVSYDLLFGGILAVLASIGLVIAYRFHFSPVEYYDAHTRPRMSWWILLASLIRGLIIGVAAICAGWFSLGWPGVTIGAVIGVLVTLLGTVLGSTSPLIEWWADRLPLRYVGAFGAVLFLIGLSLSSIQYIVIVARWPLH